VKRVLFLLLTVMMIISVTLTACSGPAGSSSGSAPESTTGASAADSSTAAETAKNDKPYAGTKISIAFWESPVTEFYKQFERDTGIIVEYEQISGDQIYNVINARLLAGEGPDIFGARFEDAYYARAEAGELVDLTDIPYWDKIDPGVVDLLRAKDGKLYGIPEAPTWICTVYNVDIFKKYNLSIPKNIDEYFDVCEKLVKEGVIPTVQGAADLSYCKWVGVDPIFQLLMSDFDYVRGFATGTSNFTDPQFVEALTLQKKFIDSGYLYKDSISMTIMQAWEFFCKGNVAMINGGSYFGPLFSTIVEPEFEYSAMALPTNKAGDEQAVPYSAVAIALCLNAKGKNIEASKQFVEYWMTHLKEYADISGKPSAMAEDYDYAPYASKFKLPGIKRIGYVREPSAIASDYSAAIQNLIMGASVEEVVNELQSKLDAIR
jgi:raffinose/stachyose/melibiose transport system substrate-binding protein